MALCTHLVVVQGSHLVSCAKKTVHDGRALEEDNSLVCPAGWRALGELDAEGLEVGARYVCSVLSCLKFKSSMVVFDARVSAGRLLARD